MRHALLPVVVAAFAHQAQAQSEPVATRPTATKPPVIDSAFVAREDSIRAAEAPRRPSCWRARASCKVFFLTDIGFEYGVLSTKTSYMFGDGKDFEGRLIWTVGVMGGRGNHAHGPAFSMTTEAAPDVFPYILEYRYRYWEGDFAIDAGVGYKRSAYSLPAGFNEAKGISMLFGFTPNRWIGLNARWEYLRSPARDYKALLVGAQSTRVSEFLLVAIPTAVMRELLGRIGIDTSNEPEPERTNRP